MSTRYDSRIEEKIFLLLSLSSTRCVFSISNSSGGFWLFGWYVIIVVYHYPDDGCGFREANAHFMSHYYKKTLYGYNFLCKNVSN